MKKVRAAAAATIGAVGLGLGLGLGLMATGPAAAEPTAVTFAVTIGGVDGQPYYFHILGPDMVTFHDETGTSGKTERFKATRDQVNQMTGYCVVLPISAGPGFKASTGDRSKSRCVYLKGAGLRNGSVVTYKNTLYPPG